VTTTAAGILALALIVVVAVPVWERRISPRFSVRLAAHLVWSLGAGAVIAAIPYDHDSGPVTSDRIVHRMWLLAALLAVLLSWTLRPSRTT
jgi:hypothetical protein